jgi:glycosyltransferase involved in cell wall biosynthesis
MKILHILNTTTFSGAENVVFQIFNIFRYASNIEMAYGSPDGQIRMVLYENNIRFFPMSRLCYTELKRIVEEYKPDIIHGHDIRAAFYISCLPNKVKLIHSIHGNDLQMRKLSLKAMLYLCSSIRASHVFWVSRSCLEQYRLNRFILKKSSVLGNVIDSNSVIEKCMKDSTEYDFNVVFVGRIAYPKNPQRLLKVFKLAIDLNKSIKIAIVGSGNLENTAKELAKEYKIEEYVHFLGFQSNPLKIIASSKVMVMTSDWEGTPMVALEAMILGIPIVSTPTDGLCDVIDDGITGYLSSENTVLAHRIAEIVSNPELFIQLSENQKKKSKIINNLDLYREQLEKAYGLE